MKEKLGLNGNHTETFIAIEKYNDAREFLKALWLHDRNRWGDPSKWIFRGQGDTSWDLTSSLYRPDKWDELLGSLDHQKKEDAILNFFRDELLHQGIEPPSRVGKGLRIYRGEFSQMGKHINPPLPEEEKIALMILAQHHG